MDFTFPYLTLSIWRCFKFLVIEAKSLQEDRSVLDKSSSDISELMLRRNQDKQLLHVELMRIHVKPTLGAKSL